MIALAVFGPAAIAGVATFLVTRRWPLPTAPRLGAAAVSHELARHRRLRTLARRRVDPAPATGLALTAAAALALAGVSAVGVLLAMVRTNRGLAQLDAAAARFGADHATTASTELLRAVSQLGGTSAVVGAAVLCLLAGRDRPATTSGFLIALVGGQFALSNAIKLIVDRARPDLHPLTGFAGTSFPSGHATAATACWLGFALLLGRRRSMRVKAVLAAVAVAVGVAVAATRVLLGVHWLTDVLAGIGLGAAWFAVVS
ncbi:MAG: phosphatase PAP2 family protein, partial [Acidimicrobiia bacterium]